LSGDGPGYSAKYCMYTLMDSAIDVFLDYSCTETGNSVAMEKEDGTHLNISFRTLVKGGAK